MNGLFAGLGMLGAAMVAARKGPHYDIHLARVGEDIWTAWITGEATMYLKPYQQQATSNYGWDALMKLAEKWRRAGFAE